MLWVSELHAVVENSPRKCAVWLKYATPEMGAVAHFRKAPAAVTMSIPFHTPVGKACPFENQGTAAVADASQSKLPGFVGPHQLAGPSVPVLCSSCTSGAELGAAARALHTAQSIIS